ncbi:MAG: RNA-binding domain-containing protein [Candidatus Hadarchaeales archaeon]
MTVLDDYGAISVKIETFCHATEDENKVMKAMHLILPEGTEITKSRGEGYHKNPIIVFSAETRERKVANAWFNDILKKLDERGLVTVVKKIEAMDSSNTIYLRFDKQEAFLGKLVLRDTDDVLRVRIKLTKKRG